MHLYQACTFTVKHSQAIHESRRKRASCAYRHFAPATPACGCADARLRFLATLSCTCERQRIQHSCEELPTAAPPAVLMIMRSLAGSEFGTQCCTAEAGDGDDHHETIKSQQYKTVAVHLLALAFFKAAESASVCQSWRLPGPAIRLLASRALADTSERCLRRKSPIR